MKHILEMMLAISFDSFMLGQIMHSLQIRKEEP